MKTEERDDDFSNGYVFINRLGIQLKFSVEGTSAAEFKNNLAGALVKKGTNKNIMEEESKELETQTMEEALNAVDESQPNYSFKKLAIIKRFT